MIVTFPLITMRQGSPLPEIDAASADEVFGHIETVIIPTESAQQTDVSQHHEKAERQNIQTQAESMMKKTVTTLKTLFGFGEPSRRPRTGRSLGGVQNLEARMLMSGTPAEIRMIDTNGAYVLQQETLTEAKKIDFSTLAPGVYPEKWTTTIEGLGQVTMWFQGGTRVDSKGISAVQQPLGGTGFWFRFDSAPTKVLSAELEKEAATQGFVRIVKDNDYVRENGSIKNFNFAPNINFGNAFIDRIDGGQNSGRVSMRSITVASTKTQNVKDYIEPTVTDTNANGTADELALAQQEGLEEVLAPVGVTMEVIGNQGVRGIRITAPFDETYLDTGRWGVIKTVHQGGANDLRIFNNYLTDMMDNTTGSQTKVWKLYADKEMQVPLSELTFVGNRGGISLLSAVSQPVQKNMLPEGIETEPVPKLHIAHLSGPNVLFQVSSPIAQSTIEFAGVHADSILGIATVMKNAEGVMNSASITMNPANPSGDYNVLMKGPDGRVFERVMLRWNRDTKKLTLGTGEAMWIAPESLQPSVDAAVTGLTQNLMDMTTSDQSLAAIQGEILRTAASSMPGMQHDFDTAFWGAHPEWKDDAINAKALADSQTSNFSYGQIRQGLINQRNDTLSLMRESYGKFEGMLGNLLKQASQILCQIRNGANETELRRLFAITVDSYRTSLPMGYLGSIGIMLPTSTQILFAAKCAGEQTAEVLHAVKNKNVIQQMNQQTFASNGLVVHKDGTYMLAGDLRLEEERYYVDANRRLSLLSPIGTRIVVTSLRGAPTAPKDEIKDVNGYIDLGSNSEIHISDLSMLMQPNGYKVFTFELTQDDMVNIDVPGTDRNLSVTIQGVNLPAGGYTSNKSKASGESISLKLTTGRYTVTVQDTTNYATAFEFGHVIEKKPFDMKVNIDAETFDNRNIVGKISIDGSEKTMPVSMRVAEFDELTGKRKEAKDARELKTDKPVWVVIHGREDRDDSGKMLELQKALTDSGYQVVTIDWREAAGSSVPESVGMQSESWIQGVADWSFRALKAAGIQGANTRIGGHSFGSLIGFEIAEDFKAENGFGVDTFIALDSAKDATLSTRYDASQLNFAAVSKTSTAIHSSFWGSSGRSNTAEHTIELRSPVASYDVFENQTRKHGLAVTTFANLIRLKKIDPTNDIAEQFAFQSSENSTLPKREGVDGWLFVASALKNGSDSSDAYIDALPEKMTYTDPDDNLVDSYMFNTLLNLNHSISQ